MRHNVFLTLSLMMLMASLLMAGDGTVDANLIEDFQMQYQDKGDHTTVRNAVANNNLSDLVLNQDILTAHNTFINFKLESTSITHVESVFLGIEKSPLNI